MQPKYVWRRKLLRGILRTVGFGLVKVEASGLENIPDSGPSILMMNHISFIDPIICSGVITNRFVISMSKIENMKNPIVGFLIRMWGNYTVKRGEIDRAALMNSIELLKSGQLILIAPEGTRHPEGLAPAKDGLAYVATKAEAVIIPAALAGADEGVGRLKKLRRGYARVNLGRPFRLKTGGRSRIPREELSAMMEEAMYQLALAIPEGYDYLRGAYGDMDKVTTRYLEFVDPRAPESLRQTL